VVTDPKKIEAMKNWPVSKSFKELRVFLGLASNCKKFIRKFGVISRILINLLKKNNFRWHDGAHEAFDLLKKALYKAPVLALPNFNKTFVLEIDACAQD
jgi:hypothetical protein